MAVTQEEFEVSQSKSLRELGTEAIWFTLHTLFAIGVVVVIMLGGYFFRAAQDDLTPKLIGTLAAFVLALGLGFVIAKVQQNEIARYVWISGLLIFSAVCVWVLDLPTGNGLCEHCGAIDKLYRTFFDITHGSGLMGGDGLLIGTWVPLALFGYAIGANMGLDPHEEAEEE
ncbi:hypothetical protein ACFQBQ_02580 [Granulicella cerasi]|uniref:Uncharacterized protein n=1 Tax=Granulicella cerasi TaxID=741063 RepID=A0ABW1Z4L2_9BACT|nr:hypothetical protein [Granulicella cerasi]